MRDALLASLGMYGGSFVIALIAGLVPLLSIELFLVGLAALARPSVGQLALCAVLGAVGHQIAKTITYYGGVGALEHGRIKGQIDKHRARIEKWNKAPHLVLAIAGSIGLPPMYLIGFIAHPLMGIRIVPFTVITFVTRLGRYLVVAAVPLLW